MSDSSLYEYEKEVLAICNKYFESGFKNYLNPKLLNNGITIAPFYELVKKVGKLTEQYNKESNIDTKINESNFKNEIAIYKLYKKLLKKIDSEDFLEDKSGVKIVELFVPKIQLNPQQLFINFEGRKTPEKYVKKEEDWYLSHDLKIDKVGDVQIWQHVSDDNNEINSNYGNLVFSRNNFSQFENVARKLESHQDTRQAIIIYTRPSIHYEWNSLGAGDFICTNYQHFFIRNNKLNCITSMRSNDLIYGFTNDIYWFHFVIQKMHERLIKTYEDLELGDNIFIPNSLHVYERHFDKVREVVEKNKEYDL